MRVRLEPRLSRIQTAITSVKLLLKKASSTTDLDELLASLKGSQHPLRSLRVAAFQGGGMLLTERQQRRARDLHLNWSIIWGRWKHLQMRAAVSSFVYKLLNNALPIATEGSPFEAFCACGERHRTFWHILDCSKLCHVRRCLKETARLSTGVNIDWSEKSIIEGGRKQRQRYVVYLATWCLWKIRNKLLWEQRLFSFNEIRELFASELSRLKSLHFELWSPPRFCEVWGAMV